MLEVLPISKYTYILQKLEVRRGRKEMYKGESK